jgi:hypothetical protein
LIPVDTNYRNAPLRLATSSDDRFTRIHKETVRECVGGSGELSEKNAGKSIVARWDTIFSKATRPDIAFAIPRPSPIMRAFFP